MFRQPASPCQLVASLGKPLLLYVPSIGYKRDFLGQALTTSGAPMVGTAPAGVYTRANTDYTQGLSPVTALRVPTEATLISYQRVVNTGANGWHAFQDDTTQSHFCYSGFWYASTFSNTRWLSGVAPGIDTTRPHVVVVTARNNDHRAFINGVKVGNATNAGAVAMSSFQFIGTNNSVAGQFNFDGETYCLIILPRALTDAEVAGILP